MYQVAEAEKEKAKSEHNHKRRSEKYAELQAKIQVQEKKFGRSIKKAKQYFELKAELDVKLMVSVILSSCLLRLQ